MPLLPTYFYPPKNTPLKVPPLFRVGKSRDKLEKVSRPVAVAVPRQKEKQD